jgi:hypothetical protein
MCHVKKIFSARRRIVDHGSGVRGHSIDRQDQAPGADEPGPASEAGNQEAPAALQANTRPYCVPPPISQTNAMQVWCPNP